MGTKPAMKLKDPYTGLMECRVCGAYHHASIKPRSNGRYYRGSWQCVHGCKVPTKTEVMAYDGWRQRWIDASAMYIPR